MNLQRLATALEGRGIEVSNIANTLNLSYGTGLHAQKVNIDLETALQAVPDRVALYHYSVGMSDLLKESKRSLARRMSFAQSAATLLPQVHHKAYVDATRAAGDEALYEPLLGDLVMTFTVRTDKGLHVISRRQFEAWGVARARFDAAARSMLFHHTDGIAHDAHDHYSVLRKGDSHDPARYIVAEDHADIPTPVYVAFPTDDELWVSNEPHFGTQVAAQFEESARPLSSSVYRLNSQTLVEYG